MKKNIILLLVITLTLLVGCGVNVENEIDVVEVDVQGSSYTKSSLTEPEVPTDDGDGNTAQESPLVADGDFSINDLGDGTCTVSLCSSEANIIDVPQTIYDLTVVGINQFAFNQSNAQKIKLPDTVKFIESYAFTGCENLVEVSLGAGLERAGEMIFNECPCLESVSFPEGMTTMEQMTFGFCDALGEVFIPETVTDIPDGIAIIEMCPNIVIVTPAGSQAEEVALEYGLPVVNS